MALQFPSTLLLFTFSIILFTIFLKKWKKSKHLDESKLPPGPKRLPIIGNLHQIAGTLPYHSMTELAKKHGPIMSLQLGEIMTIVISSPKLAKEVLKTHELSFAQRPKRLAMEFLSYENASFIFCPYGESWRQMRKITVLELLSMNRVMSFRPIREDEARQMVESITKLSDHGKRPINLTALALSRINNITSRAEFGERCKYQEDAMVVLNEAVPLTGAFGLPDVFPSAKIFQYISGLKPKCKRLHRKIDVILNHILQEHRDKLENSGDSGVTVTENLMDMLLNLQKNNEHKSVITEDAIKTVLVEIFSAGTDTSASAIEWAMLEMLLTPRVMQKAQAEVRQHLKGKTLVSEPDMQCLKYLKLVVKETLRLHPSVPLVVRHAREKCEIHGYVIPEDATIFVNAWAIGRDPEYWSNPDEFRPERFMDSNLDYRGTNFEYVPFGSGRRMCPGITLAISSIELLLAQMLYSFDWGFPDGTTAEDIDMTEVLGISARRKENLFLTAKPYVGFSDEHCE